MRLTTALLAASLTLPALAADITIDDVAPTKTAFVMRIHNWTDARTALEDTPMWTSATRPEMKSWLTSIAKENFNLDELTADLEQLGVEPGEFPQPDGHIGLAVWMSPEQYASPNYLALAHFGKSAEDMFELLLDNADLEEERGNVTVEIDDDADHQILSIRTVFDAGAEREGMLQSLQDARAMSEDADEEFWDEMEQNIHQMDFTEAPSDTHIARSRDWLLASSELEPLEDALAILLGDEIPSIAGTPGLDAMRLAVNGTHADAVILPSAVAEFFDELTNALGIFLPIPLDGPLGFDQINGIAAGLTLDAPDAQAELKLTVPLTNQTGLFTLVDTLDALAPPPFIPADTASLSAFAVDFTAALPLAREFVMSFPEDERAQMEASLTAFSFIGGPILDSIGPEVYAYQRYARPLSPTSDSTLFAIRVRNEAVIAGSLAQYAQAMGAEPREFLGSQIWEAPAMVGDAIAVGLGASWAFIGPPAEIEDAFRRLSDEAPDALSTHPEFKRAATTTNPAGSFYAYLDPHALIEFNQWIANNTEAYVRSIFSTPEWSDEEYIQSMVEYYNEIPMYKALREGPNAKAFKEALGPSIQEYHLTNTGIKGRWLILRPE